ncbi:hypothetical protein HpDR22_14190 [Helicobacter pylori]
MKMAEGYEPLKTFLKKPSVLENEEKDGIFRINNAIQELCKDNHHMALSLSYYSQTQGLRSRLKILTHLAKLLFRLQSKGLVYGDLNLNNVFYKDNSAFLIDADNVRYESEKALCVIFTPNYGALEISQTSKNSDTTNYNTMLSDTFSFAIIAYELLNMVHPFDGNSAGDAENFIELPWIEDSEDDSNNSCGLLPFFLPTTLFKGIEVVESEWEFAEIANNILIFHHDIQQEKILINNKRLDHHRIEIDLEKELTISYNGFLIKVQKC